MLHTGLKMQGSKERGKGGRLSQDQLASNVRSLAFGKNLCGEGGSPLAFLPE